MINQGKRRIVIRIGKHHLSFSTIETVQEEQTITYEPYVMKSGISLPANLREAFLAADLPQTGLHKALVMVDTQVLLVPVEQFEEASAKTMYDQAFPKQMQDMICYNVIADLNAVAVYAVSKDLNTVLRDNFADVQFMAMMVPVWRHLHKRSFTGNRNKMYGYFHDQKLEIFSFHQNRFKFCNQFETTRQQDALYFLLYVWKQLQLNAVNDEMHLVGDMTGDDSLQQLAKALKAYVQNVYVVNPEADLNQAPATKISGLPYDLMTLFTKGR